MKQTSLYYFNLLISIVMVIIGLAFSLSMAESDQKIKDAMEKGGKTEGQHMQKGSRTSSLLLHYRPPMRGRPVNRVGGGTRGNQDHSPRLVALVPNHTGLTIHSQPVLYWFFSGHVPDQLEFTLIDEEGIEPVLEKNIHWPEKDGMACIRLSDFDIHLIQGVDYQWFVAAIPDPEQRSKDIVASGRIRRIAPSKGLMNKLNHANNMEIPGIYAEEGLWYDALSTISALIDADPNNKVLWNTRSDLLQQAGISRIFK